MNAATGTFRIEFKLHDQGWADCFVSTPEGVFEISGFGDCTDALGDLLRAGLLMATGAVAARVSFDGEPMEWKWIIERRPFDPLLVKVATFPDIHARAPDAQGDLLFSTACSADEFARAVANAAQQLLDEVGVDGYAQRWRLTGFPLRALRALQAALVIEEPERQPLSTSRSGGGISITGLPE